MPIFTDDQIITKALEEAADYGNPRCAFLTKALSLNGLAYANGATRNDYVAELYLEGIFARQGDTYAMPPGTVQQANSMAASQSSCGITTEAIWRYAGVDDPVLYQFYSGRVNKGLYAVKEERDFAIKTGAWVDALPWRRGTPFPELGDAVIIGDNTPAMARGVGNFQHEFTVVGWGEGPQGALCNSLDGGQPGIALRTRGLVEVWTGQNTGELWFGNVAPDGSIPLGADGRPLTGRRCIGYARADKLPLRSGFPPACTAGGGGGLLGAVTSGVGGQVLAGVLVAAGVLAGASLLFPRFWR